MKFKKSGIFSMLICLLLFTGCSKDDEPVKDLEVVLDSYKFIFPPGFKYETQLEVDFWWGTVSNDKMIFHFDHGTYVDPPNDGLADTFEITEEDFEGRYLRIARPRDSQNDWTSIYISADKEVEEGDLYGGLHIRVTNLSAEEQELAISIFRTVTIVTPVY